MEAEIKTQIPGIDPIISEYVAVGKNITLFLSSSLPPHQSWKKIGKGKKRGSIESKEN